MRKKLAALGLESIAFQKDPRFFNELVVAFGRLRAAPEKEKAQEIIDEIVSTVKRYTNISTQIIISKSTTVSATAVIYPVTKDHPLYDKKYRDKLRDADFSELTSDKKELVSSIDFQNGKVYGYFATTVNPIILHLGLFSNGIETEEIAAVFLHELGHLFGYYMLVSRLAVTNMVLREVADVFSNTNDKKIRIELLTEVENIYDHKFEDKETLADTKDASVPVSIASVVATDWVRSELGLSYYDGRTCEFLADQFATRHGAGRYLVTFFDKNNRGVKRQGFESTQRLIFSNLMSFMLNIVDVSFANIFTKAMTMTIGLAGPIGFLMNVVTGTVFSMVYTLIMGTRNYEYDDPKGRYEAIRREIVSSLKDPSNPREFVTEQLQSLEVIDAHINKINPIGKATKALSNFFYDYINGSYKEIKFQRQYEELANNDLFVRAAQLKQMA